MLQFLPFAIVVAALFAGSSADAQTRLPDKNPLSPFTGVWIEANDKLSACKASDLHDLESDGAIQIHSEKVRFWERTCDINRMQMMGSNTAEVDLTCIGEGMRWKTRQVWHAQRVGGKPLLVMVTTEVSDERDEDGKKVSTAGDGKPPYVWVFAACAPVAPPSLGGARRP